MGQKPKLNRTKLGTHNFTTIDWIAFYGVGFGIITLILLLLGAIWISYSFFMVKIMVTLFAFVVLSGIYVRVVWVSREVDPNTDEYLFREEFSLIIDEDLDKSE